MDTLATNNQCMLIQDQTQPHMAVCMLHHPTNHTQSQVVMLPASHMQPQPHILLHNIYKNEGRDQETENLALTAAGL